MRTLRIIGIVVVLIVGGYFVIDQYSFIFSKRVRGEIIEVEKPTTNTVVMGGANLRADQIFSVTVAIRGDDGRIYTASSEDRQWAVARKGYCADARFYPYPPWNFEKSNTYFNARLLELIDCKGRPQVEAAPAPGTSPVPQLEAPSATPAL